MLKILIPLVFVIIFVYIIISFFDTSDRFSTFPTLFLLGIGSLVSIRVLFYTRLQRYERKKIIVAITTQWNKKNCEDKISYSIFGFVTGYLLGKTEP